MAFSSVDACLIIPEGWTAGVWILMENKAFRCNFAKIRKIPEKYGNILFSQMTKGSRKEERRGVAEGPHPLGTGPPWAAPRAGVAHLPGSRLPTPPLHLYLPPKPR